MGAPTACTLTLTPVSKVESTLGGNVEADHACGCEVVVHQGQDLSRPCVQPLVDRLSFQETMKSCA
jgi:hypothetical protein